jgi:hypothetical protein
VRRLFETRNERAGLFLILLFVVGLFAGQACTLATTSSRSTPTASSQAANRDELAKYATALRQVAAALEGLQAVEIAYHDAGQVPDQTHARIQVLFKGAAVAGRQASEALEDLTVPTATRADLVAAFVQAVSNTVADDVFDPVANPQIRATLKAAAGNIRIGLAIASTLTPF